MAGHADPLHDSVLKPWCLPALEVVREPQGASELEMAGLWTVIFRERSSQNGSFLFNFWYVLGFFIFCNKAT